MVTLVCAVVGEEGSAFSVEVDENKLVDLLKDAIAVKQKYAFAASKLQLFLAKKDGAWLPYNDPAALKLKKGEIPNDIQTVIDGEELEETWTIQDVLADKSMPEPLSRQIHVLVVVPSHIHLDIGGPGPKVLTCNRYIRWARSATSLIRPVCIFLESIIVAYREYRDNSNGSLDAADPRFFVYLTCVHRVSSATLRMFACWKVRFNNWIEEAKNETALLPITEAQRQEVNERAPLLTAAEAQRQESFSNPKRLKLSLRGRRRSRSGRSQKRRHKKKRSTF